MKRTRKPTIAELREREIYHLAKYKNPDPTPADLDEARRNMNSFYRLCALGERVAELSNNARTCNRASTKAEADREYKWFLRLDETFQKLYSLEIHSAGPAYCIAQTVNNSGAIAERIATYFYERRRDD